MRETRLSLGFPGLLRRKTVQASNAKNTPYIHREIGAADRTTSTTPVRSVILAKEWIKRLLESNFRKHPNKQTAIP
jgi:hypothetical protein